MRENIVVILHTSLILQYRMYTYIWELVLNGITNYLGKKICYETIVINRDNIDHIDVYQQFLSYTLVIDG